MNEYVSRWLDECIGAGYLALNSKALDRENGDPDSQDWVSYNCLRLTFAAFSAGRIKWHFLATFT